MFRALRLAVPGVSNSVTVGCTRTASRISRVSAIPASFTTSSRTLCPTELLPASKSNAVSLVCNRCTSKTTTTGSSNSGIVVFGSSRQYSNASSSSSTGNNAGSSGVAAESVQRITHVPNAGHRAFIPPPTKEANQTASFVKRLWDKYQLPPGFPPKYERWSRAWYWETAVQWTVFAITGSTAARFVRPAITHLLGLEGSLIEGPWSYRIASIIVLTPVYSAMLVAVGALFRRYHYFYAFAGKMWKRMFLIRTNQLKANELVNTKAASAAK